MYVSRFCIGPDKGNHRLQKQKSLRSNFLYKGIDNTLKGEGITFIWRHKRHLQLQRRCCATDRAGIQPIGRRRRLRPQTLTYDQTSIRSAATPPKWPVLCRVGR